MFNAGLTVGEGSIASVLNIESGLLEIYKALDPYGQGFVFEVGASGTVNYSGGTMIIYGFDWSETGSDLLSQSWFNDYTGAASVVFSGGNSTLAVVPRVSIDQTDDYTEVDEKNTTTDTFTVVLPSVPGSNVTVTLDPDRNSGDFRLNAAAAGDSIDLIFTTGNWDSVQTVTVEAVSDADTVYREHGDMLISSLSGDSDYNLGLFDIVAVNIPDTNLSSDESGMLQSSTWVATDDLGRDLPTYEEVGPPKSDKTVALFYFLWLGEHGQGGPYDITKILEADPCNPAWGGVPAFHHWGESELGYYLSSEEYVMRKHVQLLNYAGVDVLVFDGTNGNPYLHNVLKLCKVLEDVKTEDGKCPKIAWFTYNTVQQLYDEFYSVNKYPDLWYYWEGKPLILGEDLTGYSAEIQNFFSRKALGAWAGGEDLWTWTDWTPQRFGWDSSPDTAVQTAVAVAMQETYMSNTSTAHGRHFENEYGPDGTEPDPQ